MKYSFWLVWAILKKFHVQAKLSFTPYASCVPVKGGRESLLFSQARCAEHVLLRRFQNLLGGRADAGVFS